MLAFTRKPHINRKTIKNLFLYTTPKRSPIACFSYRLSLFKADIFGTQPSLSLSLTHIKKYLPKQHTIIIPPTSRTQLLRRSNRFFISSRSLYLQTKWEVLGIRISVNIGKKLFTQEEEEGRIRQKKKNVVRRSLSLSLSLSLAFASFVSILIVLLSSDISTSET